MNSKGHFYISVAKSIIRIMTCVLSIFSLYYGLFCSPVLGSVNYILMAIATLPVGLLVAEVLGIAEEVADKRK